MKEEDSASHLKNVVSGERLGRVPAESHEGGGDRNRKQNYVQHLETDNIETHTQRLVNTHFNFQVQGARIVTKTIPGHAGKLTAVLKFKTLFLGHPF